MHRQLTLKSLVTFPTPPKIATQIYTIQSLTCKCPVGKCLPTQLQPAKYPRGQFPLSKLLQVEDPLAKCQTMILKFNWD